jgi:hypothetical protein
MVRPVLQENASKGSSISLPSRESLRLEIRRGLFCFKFLKPSDEKSHHFALLDDRPVTDRL